MNSTIKHSGAWIFVSHSHRDLEKVREIRNYLEARGANPLLFFLKCLNDEDSRLPDLIADEIRARNFFVICDSPNARASRYVPKEVALIRSEKPTETIAVIDLDRDLKTQMEEIAPKITTTDGQNPVEMDSCPRPESQYRKLDRLLKRATVFLSYALQDRAIADRIRQALEQKDYSVWLDRAIHPGGDWAAATQSAIDDAIGRGFVLVLLSSASLASRWVKYETEYALQLAARSRRSNVLPVVIEPFAPGSLPLQFAHIQWFDLTTGPFDQRVQELIRSLKTREME